MPSDPTLTLFIPDLFGFQSTFSQLSQEELSQLPVTRFPILEKWLSRGKIIKSKQADDVISSEFGISVDKNKDRPYAALSLLAENTQNIKHHDYYWLRADPVCLYADRDTVLLSAHDELSLSQDEANELVNTINQHFKDEPWTLFSFAPHRWYLALDKTAELVTKPLHEVMGKNIYHHAAEGSDAGYWKKISNEIQMLLHGTKVNTKRQSTNQHPVNSLWLWGGGKLPTRQDLDQRHDVVISNDIYYTGVGYHCGLDVLAVDSDFVNHIQNTNSFVVLDMLSEHVVNLDVYRFMQTLAELENKYLSACNELLLANKFGKVVLLIDDETSIHVTKKQLRHWWKRTRPFVKFNYA